MSTKSMEIKDSGERQGFETGAVRDTANGKYRPELISPVFVERFEDLLESGYSPTGSMAKAMRAINDYRMGHRHNADDGCYDYLMIAAAEVMVMLDDGTSFDGSTMSPELVKRLGNWLALGAAKYAARNWEKGIPLDRTMASLLRHINEHRAGDRSEDHLAAIECNLMFLVHTEEMIKRCLLPAQLADIPSYLPAQEAKHE